MVAIPSIGEAQVTKLKFGAVNYQADLYVDGTYVDSSIQSHTEAVFDISEFVTPGSSCEILVHVKGHDQFMLNGRATVPDGAGSWSETLPDGIFRSAELLIYPEVNIQDVFVRPYVSDSSLYYDVWLQNAASSARSVTLSGTLSSWNGTSWSYPALPSQPMNLPADSVTKVTVGPVAWNLGIDSYWWPNVPYREGYSSQLHNLNLLISGDVSHSTSVRFGFRECTQGPDGQGNVCYFLNGIRVNFRGDSLQGANYDRIDYNGQGNAYDTYPGFLEGANGWRKAVDNYQRLNYNVVRVHQIPASPFMLDVCDEMGLMIIDETGIRGAGAVQDFEAGWNNMVNHVKQLFSRDRNHASVVRLSQSNEPDWGYNDSQEFEQALYDAAMEVDGTRPISIDSAWYDFDPKSEYGGVDDGNADNFAAFPHYGTDNAQWGNYTDEVFYRSDRPYGSGEFIWDADNTKVGFIWFGTSVQAMRAKGASDARPYTLLSAWASVIPGVSTTDMTLENPPWNSETLYPLYGENNLSDPWSNPHIQRVQAGFSPVLVADAAYWELNKTSNENGDWPASVEKLSAATQVTRELNIFNDTFADGTAVDVVWELRLDSASGTIVDSGVISTTVPYGYMINEDLTFTTPDAPDGTLLYLVLSAEKGGVELFREEQQYFELTSLVSYPLTNAGFELPATGKISEGFDASRNDVPGWNDYGTMSDSGIESAGIAHTGSWSAYLYGRDNGEGGIYQMTGYTIQAGDVFTLGYWAKVDYEDTAGASAMTGVLFWDQPNDSSREISWTAAQPLSSSWTYYEMTIEADSVPGCIGSELGIEFINSGGDWAGLDDVVLYISSAEPTANSAPSFDADPVVKADATDGAAYSGSLAGDASDPDGDSLTFSVTAGPSWLTVDSNGTLSGTPSSADVGLNSWTIQVADGKGGTDTATLEVTVGPAGPVVDIYISEIAMASASFPGSRYGATATVTVTDASGAAVPDATVSVVWSGAVSGTDSGVTDASGAAVFDSAKVKNGGTFTIAVTGVTASGSSYNATLNVETSDSVTAP